MGKYPISELPEGYIIIPLQKKYVPMKLVIDNNGIPHAHGFKSKDKAVSYSKRVYAAHFIEQHKNGTLDWAKVAITD